MNGRPSQASIDAGALRHNYTALRRLHGGRALAVLKADAYGHGAIACASALADIADGFAVAFVEEAIALREAGVRLPILVLQGFAGREQLEICARSGLWVVVHHHLQARELQAARLPAPVHVWLKLNSGMNRMGFSAGELREVYGRLRGSPSVAEITLMTHFARSDEPDVAFTAEQLALFDRATQGLAGDRSLCNSAAVLAWPAARRDWARLGIAMYGASPVPSPVIDLEPVMALRSQVVADRVLKPGDPLGYGGAFVAETDMRIGLVPVGYGDGYPRHCRTGTPVLVAGRRTGIVGRICMDVLFVDLTSLPDAGIGSPVELWGPNLPVNEVAQWAASISYELLSSIKRLPKVLAPA